MKRLRWIFLSFMLLGLFTPALAEDTKLAEAQQILLMLGLSPGRGNGEMNPKTAEALAKFQAGNNLSVTGRLDEATLTALRAKRDKQLSHSLNLAAPGSNATQSIIRGGEEPKLHGIEQAPLPVETESLGGNQDLSARGGSRQVERFHLPGTQLPTAKPGATWAGAGTENSGAVPENSYQRYLIYWPWAALPLISTLVIWLAWVIWGHQEYGTRAYFSDTTRRRSPLDSRRREPTL